MKMEFVKTVMDNARIKTAYGLAKLLACSANLVEGWLGKIKNKPSPTGMRIRFLCMLFVISGMSGNEFMKMLCKEFLEPEFYQRLKLDKKKT